MQMKNYKSRSTRYSVDELIIITELESDEIIGNVLDFHQYGLGALLSNPIAIGKTLNIRLTRRINEQVQFIDMGVKVCWCHEKKLIKKYGVGFEIVEIQIKAKLRIDELINYYSSKLHKNKQGV